MMQAKSFTVSGVTGTRDRLKVTTLPGEIDKVLGSVLEEIGDGYRGHSISPLGAALPDCVLVTVIYEGEAKKTKK